MTSRIILEGITLEEHIELMRKIVREEIQKERDERNLHLNKGEVCKILGISRTTLYRISKEMGLDEIYTSDIERIKAKYPKYSR